MKVAIQSGHMPKPFIPGNTGASSKWMVERDSTPVVAKAAVKYLQAHKVDAAVVGAITNVPLIADIMVACHFDGGGQSGASMGYPYDRSIQLAAIWKGIYWPLFPFRKMADNFTAGLRGYYQYHRTQGRAKMVVEFGDVGDESQALWMKPRLEWLGQLLGYAVMKYMGIAPAEMPIYDGPVVPAPPAPPDVKQDIIAIQEGLLRMYPQSKLIADGIYGAKTRAWVVKFQHWHNLVEDGVFGPITKAAFDKALAAKASKLVPKVAEVEPVAPVAEVTPQDIVIVPEPPQPEETHDQPEAAPLAPVVEVAPEANGPVGEPDGT